MPQGRGKTKRKRKPKAAEPSGIIVSVEGDQMQVQVFGKTKGTEAPTLLKLAAKLAENQVGVE
jgi:hypothetical protein